MKRLATLVALAALASGALAAAPDAGLAAIGDLGRVNGQALACGQMAISGKTKALVIRHAPKTRSYGELFEETTNTAFLAQGKDTGSCPPPAELAGRLSEIAARLQAALPAAQ